MNKVVVILMFILFLFSCYSEKLDVSNKELPKRFSIVYEEKVAQDMWIEILEDNTTGISYLVIKTSLGIALTEYKFGTIPSTPNLKGNEK